MKFREAWVVVMLLVVTALTLLATILIVAKWGEEYVESNGFPDPASIGLIVLFGTALWLSMKLTRSQD